MSTINLLPPAYKEGVEYAKSNRRLLRIIGLLGTISAASFLGLGLLWFNFNLSIDKLTDKIAGQEMEAARFSGVSQQAATLQAKLNTATRLLETRPHFKPVAEEIAHARPNGVTLLTYSIDGGKDQRFSLTGNGSVQGVALFREALDVSPLFEFVDIASVSPRGDFTIAGQISKGAFK